MTAYYTQSAHVNKCVLSFFLKLTTLSIFLSTSGRLFHTVSVARVKHLEASAEARPFGFESNRWPSEQSWRVGIYSLTRLRRYWGWSVLSTLWVISATLYSMRCGTGSQCKSRSTGLMWSCFLVPQTTQANAFWIRCSLWIFSLDVPYRRELQ